MKKLPTKVTGAVNRLVHAHLEWLYRATSTRPRRVLLFSLGLFLLALLSITTIRFESDVFKLFPARQGALRLFLDSLDWTGSAREVYFLLEGEKGRLPAEAEAFAGRLKGIQVDGRPAFSRVTYRVYDQAEAKAFADFIGYAVTHPQLFLTPTEVAGFAGRFSPAVMAHSLQRARSELASQAGMGLRDIIAADPLYLRELILPRLRQGSQALDLDPASPYFLSRDGKALIIIAEPARPVQDMAFARKLVAGINDARKGARVSISCAGAHLSAVIDEREVKGNVIACVLSSLVVVLLLFYATYRRFLPTLLIPLIILYGVVLALGAAGLFLGTISLISFAFTALIIGLGTDYSIHLYDRFYSERAAGRPTDEALRLAVIDTGHGLFTAATTTALPFLALTLSDVRALFELGLLVGLGVIFSLYATFLFLPPLLIYSERRWPKASYRPLPRFGLASLRAFCCRRSRGVLLSSLLLTLFFLGAGCFIAFEGELKNLQPRHSEAFLTQEKIERHLSLSPKQVLVAVEGTNLEEVMDRGNRVESLVARYREEGEIAGWSSLGQVMNDRETQLRVVAGLTAALAVLKPEESARAALEKGGFAEEQFRPFLGGVAGLSHPGPVAAAEAIDRIGRSPLRGVTARHLIAENGRYHLLWYLFYSGPEFRQDAFLRELSAADPTARATSQDLISAQLAASVRRSFIRGFAIGGALVLLLLLAHFESLAGIVYSLFPVLAGVIAMLGLMVLTGMRLNFMNAMVLVTILGMGSDYGLHIAHRTTGVTSGRQGEEFAQAGRAVLLSAITTIAGFGSLAFTDYGALSSIGWATNYGVGATALFSLVTLPALLARVRRL